MSDLLKRLRNVRWIAPNTSEKQAEEVCLEAAAEIERLRAKVAAWEKWLASLERFDGPEPPEGET